MTHQLLTDPFTRRLLEERDPHTFVQLMRTYYGDPERTVEVPADTMYFHMGLALSMIDKLSRFQ